MVGLVIDGYPLNLRRDSLHCQRRPASIGVFVFAKGAGLENIDTGFDDSLRARFNPYVRFVLRDDYLELGEQVIEIKSLLTCSLW